MKDNFLESDGVFSNKGIWELYSSEKEYKNGVKDKFDRDITMYSRMGSMLDPTVSTYLTQNGFCPVYPNGKKFATCISHDVDHLFMKSSKKLLLKKLLKCNYSEIKKELNRAFLRKVEKDYDLKNVLAINNKYNVKSTYYFLSVENDNVEDYNYSLKEVEHYFNIIKESGNEIGLHGSKKAFNNIDDLQIEKNRLENFVGKTSGYRNHYLKFEVPTTWNILAQEGIKYDTTFGSAYCPGFRNGMCFPFQPYDLKSDKWINTYELPLIAMDVSFFLYLRLDYDKAFDLFKDLVKTIKNHNGVFTFLWHNNFMTGKMGAFYERCIEYLSVEDTWFATGDELVEWWKQKDYFNQQNELLQKIKP